MIIISWFFGQSGHNDSISTDTLQSVMYSDNVSGCIGNLWPYSVCAILLHHLSCAIYYIMYKSGQLYDPATIYSLHGISQHYHHNAELLETVTTILIQYRGLCAIICPISREYLYFTLSTEMEVWISSHLLRLGQKLLPFSNLRFCWSSPFFHSLDKAMDFEDCSMSWEPHTVTLKRFVWK